jgi:hypothetical protein
VTAYVQSINAPVSDEMQQKRSLAPFQLEGALNVLLSALITKALGGDEIDH